MKLEKDRLVAKVENLQQTLKQSTQDQDDQRSQESPAKSTLQVKDNKAAFK